MYYKKMGSKKIKREAKGRRGRKPASDEERKSRVIQTRVPEDLEATLKDAAEQKRMTVSHLIRNVLEDTFTLVDGIVSDSTNLVGHVTRDAQRLADSARGIPRVPQNQDLPDEPAAISLDDIDSWQEVIINKPGVCLRCGSEMKRGTRGFRGLTSIQNAPPVWLCGVCINNL